MCMNEYADIFFLIIKFRCIFPKSRETWMGWGYVPLLVHAEQNIYGVLRLFHFVRVAINSGFAMALDTVDCDNVSVIDGSL